MGGGFLLLDLRSRRGGGNPYLPWYPCMDCARALVQAGIVELIAVEPDLADPKWGEDFKRVGIAAR